MKRRDLLKAAPGLPLLPLAFAGDGLAPTWAGKMPAATFHLRVRPGAAGWPSLAQWDRLRHQVSEHAAVPLPPREPMTDAERVAAACPPSRWCG
ncbi:MAG: hypothetical protein WC617_17600 [Rhodanobacter sp.]|jgi:hypothetical protein